MTALAEDIINGYFLASTEFSLLASPPPLLLLLLLFLRFLVGAAFATLPPSSAVASEHANLRAATSASISWMGMKLNLVQEFPHD